VNEDRSARYHRLRRRAGIASTLAGAAWVIAMLATGGSAALAVRAVSAGAILSSPLDRALSIVVFIGMLAIGWEIVSFPFVFYRNFYLDRKYGLSSEPAATWLNDHCKALGMGLALTIVSGVAVYGSMAIAGGYWWLMAGGLFGAAALLVSRVAPVLLMPLFYRFRPLDREALRQRLLTLSNRAGVPVLGAFEWGLGEKTTRANAALVGVGGTRRILVSDTLLKDYSDDEIEVILAHEIAHHVHHDLWTALAIEAMVVTVSLYAAHIVVTQAGPAVSSGNPADLAMLPLMILAAGAVSLLLTPIGNAWSRHNERRADRFALALTHRPAAFISAMRRLGAQNLAEENPSTPVLWFFHTHPTIDERIAAARTFGRT
jgi:STE24 endopeptidase